MLKEKNSLQMELDIDSGVDLDDFNTLKSKLYEFAKRNNANTGIKEEIM